MSFKIRINQLRRRLMHSITKNVGSSHSEVKIGDIQHFPQLQN
jgi:hypothetical protein